MEMKKEWKRNGAKRDGVEMAWKWNGNGDEKGNGMEEEWNGNSILAKCERNGDGSRTGKGNSMETEWI